MAARASRPVTKKAKRDQKLRETVIRASGCLDKLSAPQRKVLRARAGVGSGAPRSRTAVARRFDITVRRVVRLERTGLKRLRSLARGGGCAPPAGAMTTQTSGATPPATAAAAGLVDTSHTSKPSNKKSNGGGDNQRTGSRGGGDDETPAGGVDPAPEKSRGGVAGVTQTNPPSGETFGFAIPLILLGLILTALLLARLHRRGRPVAVAGPDPDPEPADAPPDPAPWVPWHKSTMTGPGWNEPPTSGSVQTWREPAEPRQQTEADPEHEPWLPPRSPHRSRR